MNLFTRLQIDISFLYSDRETWQSRYDYFFSLQVVNQLRLVNDNAERGVSLIGQFNDKITSDEQQK